LIASVVVRVGRQWGETSHESADDIIQEIYLKLSDNRLEVLRNFSATDPDSIYSFVRVFAANHSHDQFKASRAKKRGGSTRIDSIENAGREQTLASRGKHDRADGIKGARPASSEEFGKCNKPAERGSRPIGNAGPTRERSGTG
jgi:hypothetical protein